MKPKNSSKLALAAEEPEDRRRRNLVTNRGEYYRRWELCARLGKFGAGNFWQRQKQEQILRPE
jgi:hypothetical protein